MKIIALMPVKNEEWILPTTLEDLSRYIDDLVVCDGSDEDNSRVVIKKYGGHLISESKTLDYSLWRSELLKKGRELGGTHFIWLDADESFTNNFHTNYIKILKSLKPGQAVTMEWICLWKSVFKQRFDNSIWVKSYKDFIFCDDQISDFKTKVIHESRTPVIINNENLIKLSPKFGAVLHFQFVPFLRFQEKQAYMRCRELLISNREAPAINKDYSITNDNTKINTINVPRTWISDFQNLEKIEALGNNHYYLKKIFNYFSEFGVEKFEPLDIWHIDALKDFFVNSLGRNPQPKLYAPSLREKISYFKASTIKAIKKYSDIKSYY
jgi:hypothetical protein